MTDSHALTKLLARWEAGDRDALVELMPAVYGDLRRLANHHMAGERAGHTLAPTALVHEVFLRLGSYESISWQDRAHFFAMASKVMRRVLVDHARRKRAAKRGGDETAVTLIESRRRSGKQVPAEGRARLSVSARAARRALGHYPPASARLSQSLATAQSRLTVGTEIPSTSAISWWRSPPKYRSCTTWHWRSSSASS